MDSFVITKIREKKISFMRIRFAKLIVISMEKQITMMVGSNSTKTRRKKQIQRERASEKKILVKCSITWHKWVEGKFFIFTFPIFCVCIFVRVLMLWDWVRQNNTRQRQKFNLHKLLCTTKPEQKKKLFYNFFLNIPKMMRFFSFIQLPYNTTVPEKRRLKLVVRTRVSSVFDSSQS